MSRRSKEEESRLVYPPGVLPPPTTKGKQRAEKELEEMGATKAGIVKGLPASAAIDNMARRIVKQSMEALSPFLAELVLRVDALEERLDKLDAETGEDTPGSG